MKKKTSSWTQFIVYWFVMYFVGLFLFPIKYPDTKMEGDVYNNFFFLLLQFTLATFTLYKMIRGDWFGDKKND